MSKPTISEKTLEAVILRINVLAGTPQTYMSEVNGKRIINIGHYHLDKCYGGYKLVQTDSDGSGIRAITKSGYTTTCNLYHEMHAFLTGLEANKRGQLSMKCEYCALPLSKCLTYFEASIYCEDFKKVKDKTFNNINAIIDWAYTMNGYNYLRVYQGCNRENEIYQTYINK